MSVGFTELALQSRISVETVYTITNSTKWQRLIAQQKSHRDLYPEDLRFVLEYEPWENINEMNFYRKCLPPYQTRYRFERALCTALIVYVHIAFDQLINQLPWTAAYKRLQDELTALVQEYTSRPEERNYMIWMRILAMASWSGRSGPTSKGSVLISKLARKSVLQGSSWAELEVIFHQFLWDEEMGRNCRSIWVEAISFIR